MEADFGAKTKILHSYIGEGAKVLDVGCGKGYFLLHCLKQGLECRGIDLSTSAVAVANDRHGLDVIQGRIEDYCEKLDRFDAVTLWATIEHLPSPLETLEAIRRVLKPGGYLLLDTGIGADWLDQLLPGCNQWYDPPQHLFVFSETGLTKLVQNAGFEVVFSDPNFERSKTRRIARTVRNGALALMMQASAKSMRMRHGNFCVTRYPVGNLIQIIARVPTDA